MSGIVWRFGDDINTDVILPGKYLKLNGPELAKHVMEGVSPGFAERVKPGDILVAGKNFGCGSSRESAPAALKYAQIGAVIAPFFARIFYRNAINLGLPVLECPDAHRIEEGDRLTTHLEDGLIENATRQHVYHFNPFPRHILEILSAGGLVNYLEQRFLKEGANR
ncbi:MAG: 3-isopropylmalate dehydratase small subunit [Bacilli bacterium]